MLVNAARTDVLYLIVMPTEKCNFRCTYCYENFLLGRMSPLLVSSIKQLIASRLHELKALNLSWFGGEPLLAPDIIADLSSFSSEQSKSYGLRYYSDITTNGYLLTRKMQQSCLDWGIRDFQVSVDGQERTHDQRRKLANGKGTFGTIWQNLLDMRELSGEFTVMITCHIDSNSLDDAQTFIDHACLMFGRDPRFKLWIREVSDLGGPNGGTLTLLSPSQMTRLEELRQYAKSLGVLTGDDEEYICYAAQPNTFVIRSNGMVGKCTCALDDPSNDVGRLDEDGTLVLDQDKMRVWTRGLESGNSSELSCPLKAK